jgi:hypothetical protein
VPSSSGSMASSGTVHPVRECIRSSIVSQPCLITSILCVHDIDVCAGNKSYLCTIWRPAREFISSRVDGQICLITSILCVHYIDFLVAVSVVSKGIPFRQMTRVVIRHNDSLVLKVQPFAS